MKLNQSVDTKTIEDFDLPRVTLSSLYTFVVFPLVFGVFSKSSIDDVKRTAGQNSENGEVDPWTWKDTLARLQYIDTIIEQTVSGAILLNSGLLAAFGALNLVLHSTGLLSEREIIVRWAMTVVCIGGIATNAILAKNLARQEYIRQWYFRIFPSDKLPLMPHNDWLEKNIPNNYTLDYPRGIIEKADKRPFICKLGKKRPGYCEAWFYILFFMACVFLVLARLSWCL